MYNEIIINRLNNLTYLSALKNSNATAITKKNPYGDIVKFYAQINKNNVIQAISFKASGCSYFIALSSYFCELVEGKTIDEALKIKEKDLIAFAELDESKHHIYPIILNTFALLVKKYRKGLETGKIVPCEVAKKTQIETKKKVTTKKSVDVREGLGEILVQESNKSSRIARKSVKTTSITEVNTEITLDESKTSSEIKKEKQLALKEAKRQAKLEKLEKKAQLKEEKRLSKEAAAAKSEKVVAVKTETKKEVAVAPVKKESTKKATNSTKSLETAKKSIKAETTVKTAKTSVTSKTEGSEIKSSKAEFSKTPAKKSASKPTKATKKDSVVVAEDKKSAKSTKVSAKKVETKEEIKEANAQVKSLHLAVINDDNDVVVSDNIPGEVSTGDTQVIVEHVEHKRRVETIRRGGNTQTIEAERVDALKLEAAGKDAHREVHSAANLNDMLSRLNSSRTTTVKDVEVKSATRTQKNVNGKVVDSSSTSNSFSSMRDSLQKMRIDNETKALPNSKTSSKDTKKIEKETKKEEPQKKGLFARLFRK